MHSDSQTELNWDHIETVLLDMDGTILDLHYDNMVWNRLVPEAYAHLHNLDPEKAHQDLLAHMRDIHGSIEFYCFDYWSDRTGLDLVDVHRQAQALVSYRPGASAFLQWLRECGKRVVIATNAHRASLLVKSERIDLAAQVDAISSSHDYGHPKEHQAFWEALQDEHDFDPATSLFVDDNEPVLAAAAEYGVAHLLCVRTPDSRRPARDTLQYPAFDHFSEIYPHSD